MYHYILTALFVFLFAFMVYFVLLLYFVFRPPPNNPRSIIKNLHSEPIENKFKVVFVGDSITHGTMSFSYVNLVSSYLGSEQFLFINAGVNADTSYDVLLRLDDIIQCDPDIVTILIGTNDVLQYLDLSPLKAINRILKHATHPKPTKDSFRKNLEDIIQRLLSQTHAVIALCSIPPLTEKPTSVPFQESINFSKIISDVAHKYNLYYLPVNEKLCEYLKLHPSSPKYPLTPSNVEKIYLRELLLRKSFDEISQENGFSLLVDNIHLNSTAAHIVADIIIDFILSVVASYPLRLTTQES